MGIGGLRSIIGAGTNHINIDVVAKASQSLTNSFNGTANVPSVVKGYDSRIRLDVFAKVAADVFAANDVKVHIASV